MQEVADACRTGAATDIIFGLALGYKSAILPTIIMCITIYIANSLAGMYGIACAALGMLGTLATGEKGRIMFAKLGLRRRASERGMWCASLWPLLMFAWKCAATIVEVCGEVCCH